MNELSVLHEQLELHKKSLKNVDESIKKLNGREELANSDRNDSANNKNGRIVTRNITYNSTSSLNNHKRKFQDEHRISSIKRHSNDYESGEEEDHAIKRKTLQSSVVSSNMPIKSKEDLIKLQNKHNGSEQRNKRIFGVLLGTLKQFKSDDKERSNTSQAIQRKELEKKIEIKKVEEIKKIIEEKKRLVEEKNNQLRNIEIIEEKIKLTEDFELWKKNQEPLTNFIRTKTKPYLFYLPKLIDSKIEKLLKESSTMIKDEILKKSKQTQAELSRLTIESIKISKSLQENETKMETTSDDKENSTSATEKLVDHSSESELDDEKHDINVRIGEEDEEESSVYTKNEPSVIEETIIEETNTTKNVGESIQNETEITVDQKET